MQPHREILPPVGLQALRGVSKAKNNDIVGAYCDSLCVSPVHGSSVIHKPLSCCYIFDGVQRSIAIAIGDIYIAALGEKVFKNMVLCIGCSSVPI